MKDNIEQIKKKVCFFVPPTTGGAERVTITIAKMLPPEEYDVSFVVVGKNLGTIVGFIPQKFKVEHLQIKKICHFPIIRIATFLFKNKFDIVFCSLIYLNIRLLAAAKIVGVKTIVRNNIELFRTESKSLQLLVKLSYKWADKVIAQQEEMRQEILSITQLPENRVITLQNPLDTELIQEKASVASPYVSLDSQIKYVWVARFSREKGQDVLVRAFNIVKHSNPNAHLYLVGKYDWNNSFDSSVREYVKNNDLELNVHFVGFDDNPYRWVRNADVYVMPSRLEGLPNSLIDAMYLGVPVVATRCIPIIERIVQDGYNGFVVDSNNDIALADGMQKALSLKNCTMSYTPASNSDFVKLFQEV